MHTWNTYAITHGYTYAWRYMYVHAHTSKSHENVGLGHGKELEGWLKWCCKHKHTETHNQTWDSGTYTGWVVSKTWIPAGPGAISGLVLPMLARGIWVLAWGYVCAQIRVHERKRCLKCKTMVELGGVQRLSLVLVGEVVLSHARWQLKLPLIIIIFALSSPQKIR